MTFLTPPPEATNRLVELAVSLLETIVGILDSFQERIAENLTPATSNRILIFVTYILMMLLSQLLLATVLLN